MGLTTLMCNTDGVLKQGGKHLMSTQHLSVRREDGAYSNRPNKKRERERERERERPWTTKMIAMGWAVKHETSKHIDTPSCVNRWGVEARRETFDEHTAPVC